MRKRPASPRSAHRLEYASRALPGTERAGRVAGGRTSGAWLTRLSLVIAVAVVIARLLMSESVREPGMTAPGSQAVPGSPGPASGLLLDLLAMFCPLLVLGRRCVDRTFTLRHCWSGYIFLLLGGWAVASTIWASDKFAAIVTSTHLFAAAGVLWGVMQSVRTWGRLWAVSALSAGLLAVLVTQGIWYHQFDRQDLIARWESEPGHQEMMRAQNIQPGTFAYIQLDNSIRHGELRGFSLSPNTYGALLILLSMVTLGTMIECIRSRRTVAALSAFILLATTGAILPLTQSRTALLTGSAGAAAILGAAFAWVLLPKLAASASALLRRRAGLFYLLGLLGIAGVVAFVIGYGVSRGTLFHDSLNFRWRYWFSSATLVRIHPIFGVGWENFGAHYLGVRVPEATEEIKDPHNFIIRFATELGLVGGVLALLWTARTWWELSRPVDAPAETDSPADAAGSRVFLLLLMPLLLGIVLNFFAAVGSADGNYILLEGMRRLLFLILLIVAGSLILLRRLHTNDPGELAFTLESSSASWVRGGLLVGLGLFMVHSLVDFAMFEWGPLFLLATLLGAALGIRSKDETLAADTIPRFSARTRVRTARVVTAVAMAGWLLLTILLVVPVVSAEGTADQADEDLRQNRTKLAAFEYESAFATSIRNADYASRAARAWRYAGDPVRALALYDAALAADPTSADTFAERAEFRTLLPTPDWPGAATDLAAAVTLDPMSRPYRLHYAEALEQSRRPFQALVQVLTAIELNERLTREERRRLTPEQLASALQSVARLSMRAMY